MHDMEPDRYDIAQSYDWNFDHPPAIPVDESPQILGDWTFCGMPVSSPLGIAAGPLLNGAWCLYYAALGFDVLTYKTVRSGQRLCFPEPNLVPVDSQALEGGETNLPPSKTFQGSWAISFGMPSKPPTHWTADVRETRRQLRDDKKLSVSVVGTYQSDWSLERLADDYAHCALLAKQSGADAVEINLSCPNVTSCDGQLYQNPKQAQLVASRTRLAIGDLQLIAKIGHDPTDNLPKLVDALAENVDGIATTNCVAATIASAFDGQPRGIGGKAILDASVRQVERLAESITRQAYDLRVVGVGGISTAADVQRYLSAGAECTHLATAAMRDPKVGLLIRNELAGRQDSSTD